MTRDAAMRHCPPTRRMVRERALVFAGLTVSCVAAWALILGLAWHWWWQ